MKNRSKSIYINVIFNIGLFIFIIVIIGVLLFYFKNQNLEDELTTVEQERFIVTQTYPTQFVIYGDAIEFHDSISVRYVDQINEENLEIEDDFLYEMIIINDLQGNINLSNEEWEIISKYVKSDNRYSFYYLGNKEIEQIYNLGIISSLDLWGQNDLSIGLTHEGNQLVTVFGTYSVNAKFLISEALIHEHVYSLKQSDLK